MSVSDSGLFIQRPSAPRLARDSGFIAQSPSARSLRVRAGTPAHPGRTWFTHAAHMLPIALSSENARSPAGASTHSGRASVRTRNAEPAQAGFAFHSRGVHPDGTRQPAQAGFAFHSRGVHPDGKSPRRRASHSIAEGFTPTARGAHIGLNSQSPSARRLDARLLRAIPVINRFALV